MRHISRVTIGLLAGLMLVWLGGGAVVPALAIQAPSPCDPVSGQVAIPQDAANSLQMAGDTLTSDKGPHSAAFDEDGLRFTPKTKGKGKSTDVRLSLAAVSQGSQTLRIKTRPGGAKGSARSWSMCNNLAYRERTRGLLETVGVYSDRVDLGYLLQKPLFSNQSQEDLKLTVSLNSGMSAEQTANGFLLTDRYLNGVVIGMPTAVDAAGQTLPLEMFGDDSALTIVVPGGWLATAKYPVTIDPTVVAWSHGSDAQYDPFIANDASHTRALVTFTDKSGDDYDVRYRLINTSNGNILFEDSVADTGDETSAVAGYNPNGPTGREYMVAYARGNRMFAQRIDADTGALIGGEIHNKTVSLKDGVPADAAIDPKGGRLLVVWVTSPVPGDLKGVYIGESGGFTDSGFEIQGTGYDERQPHVTFDPKLTSSGSFVVSWKQTNHNIYSILARTVDNNNGNLGGVITVKDFNSINVTNREIVFSTDADSETSNPGKFLAVWNRVDNNDLVAVRINNRASGKPDTLVRIGSSFVIKAGQSRGWKFNDKTGVAPDLSPSRKGWIVVWRERNHTDLPMIHVVHWVAISAGGDVGTIENVSPQHDLEVTQVDNPVVAVRTDGTVVTVHEKIPQSNLVNTLIFTEN